MNAVDLLTELSTRGIKVVYAGDKLDVEGPANAVKDCLPIIRRHKGALLNLLGKEHQQDADLFLFTAFDKLPVEWHLLWDERAAIMEFDGGLHRERAEALALTEILELMKEPSVKS